MAKVNSDYSMRTLPSKKLAERINRIYHEHMDKHKQLDKGKDIIDTINNKSPEKLFKLIEFNDCSSALESETASKKDHLDWSKVITVLDQKINSCSKISSATLGTLLQKGGEEGVKEFYARNTEKGDQLEKGKNVIIAIANEYKQLFELIKFEHCSEVLKKCDSKQLKSFFGKLNWSQVDRLFYKEMASSMSIQVDKMGKMIPEENFSGATTCVSDQGGLYPSLVPKTTTIVCCTTTINHVDGWPGQLYS